MIEPTASDQNPTTPYYQDEQQWWPTAKAHAVLMGLACPIVMRKDEPKMAKVTIIVVQR